MIPPLLAAAPAQRPVPAGRSVEASKLRRVVRALIVLVLAAWSLLLVAWLALHWGILPHIEQWRGAIETRASRALGVPVRIGSITVRSSGWIPALELRDVSLLDAQQRPALSLPRVAAAISPGSLLALELRFEQLLIDGAQLEVRRDSQGRIFVAGLDFSAPAGGDDGAAADWLFKQHEVVIRGGSLRWTDEQRAAAPLALSDVQLVVRNSLLHHDLRLDATPSAEWGERFTVQGNFTQPLLARSGDWRRWSGNAYASLPRADLRELRQHVALPFELSEGDGALRGWFEVSEGQPRAATVDLALRAVSLRLAAEVEVLTVEQVEGRFTALHNDNGTTLGVRNLGFVTADGIHWPRGDMTLAWRQRDGQAATGGEFTAQRLDVRQMAQVASRIPLGDALRQLLAELKPQGVVSDLSVRWDGAIDAPDHYQAKGLLTGLTLAARPSNEARGVGRPGLRNATLRLHATEAGGEAQISLTGGAVELPGVFEDPVLALDQLSASLLWKVEPSKGNKAAPPSLTVQVKDARFSNPDAQGELAATWSTGAGSALARGGRFPGQLDLTGKLTKGVAARAARYLPLGIPEAPRRYIERAVRSGTLANASIRVKGDLWDFPFYNARSAKDGEFRIAAKLDDVAFAYVPSVPASAAEPAYASPWPVLTGFNGELIIDRSSLEIRNAAARLEGIEWKSLQGGIRNLADHGVLTLEATGGGALADMLRFVNATPVGTWTSKALATTSGTGVAELKLGLSIPLGDVASTAVRGSLALPGNDVRITPDSPQLGAAKGRVDFTQKGFAVVGATARVLGGDTSFEGGSMPDSGLRFTGQGIATADGLRRAAELGLLSRVAGSLSGQTAYRMTLGFVHGLPEINVTSNLVGMAVDLPPPLRKAAEAPVAMRYQNTLAAESLLAGQTARDTLRFELGSLVQAQYQRDLSGEFARVLRGGIGVMEAAPTPAAGVQANINLTRLDTEVWEAAIDKLFATGGNESAGHGGYGPDHLALRAQEVIAGTRRLTKVVAGISQDDGMWRANVDAEQLNGYVEYRPPRRGAATGGSANAAAGGVGAGRVYARLSRLSLPKSEADQVESLLDQQPASVPALDIVVDDFELRGKRLGRVEIEAVNRITGEGRDALREWRLSKFNLITPEAQLTASGNWAATATPSNAAGPAAPPKRRAVMNFKLALADSGALLERLGNGKVIRGGKGQLSGQMAWLGSPLALDYPSLSGQINVAIDSGQFLKADAGAARLLGVLSLQSLPRRLALDFRDVFQEGFPFDSIAGDVKIAQGVAQTNNLRMRGVQAVVLMEGSADIARETQDLRVVVVPEINAGTASLAYAVINPAVGLGTFLAQVFLRKPLIAAGTREFHVSGSWVDPQVERVARKLGDPVPEVDAPAAAASAAPITQ